MTAGRTDRAQVQNQNLTGHQPLDHSWGPDLVLKRSEDSVWFDETGFLCGSGQSVFDPSPVLRLWKQLSWGLGALSDWTDLGSRKTSSGTEQWSL